MGLEVMHAAPLLTAGRNGMRWTTQSFGNHTPVEVWFRTQPYGSTYTQIPTEVLPGLPNAACSLSSDRKRIFVTRFSVAAQTLSISVDIESS